MYHSFHSNIMQQKHCFLALIIMINMHSKPNNNCNKKTKKLFLCNAIIFHNITALKFFFYQIKCSLAEQKRLLPTNTFMHLADAFIQSDSVYAFLVSMCVPWELNPQPFALLTQCSITEPQEHIKYLKINHSYSNLLTWIYKRVGSKHHKPGNSSLNNWSNDVMA